jgi:hypothetical protein
VRFVIGEKFLFVFLFLIAQHARGQSNPQFDVTLRVDYSSAEEMLEFFDRKTNNSARVARQPGNQIAAATSLMLARTYRSAEDFTRELELVRDNYKNEADIYGLEPTRSHAEQLRKLLAETKKRQLERRVVSTIASFFPADAKVSLTIPVFVVAMGNENAAAFVRRVVWKDNAPVFVGNDQGEQVIVLNLARNLSGRGDIESEFVQVLSTLAHECFHAVFGAYRAGVAASINRNNPAASLADLVQNEGIAYYLSLQLQIGGATPPTRWFDATERAIKTLNSALIELQSPSLTPQRARELMMNSNLSGSFEGNYGATAGLRMAYEIDTRLGRPALAETILGGVKVFFAKYDDLCRLQTNLPRLDQSALRDF